MNTEVKFPASVQIIHPKLPQSAAPLHEPTLAEVLRGALLIQSVDQLSTVFGGEGADGDIKGIPRITKSNAKSHFRRWSYVGATAFADGFAMVNYEAQRLTPGRDKKGPSWGEDWDTPLGRLIRRPNPFMTFRFMLYYMALDLSFQGTHYWKIVFNGLEEPAELWPIMGEMTPKTDPEKFITGYKLRYETENGTREQLFAPDEIVAFKLPMLQNAHDGASPFAAMSGSVKLDDEILRARWKTFKRGVFPFLILYMSEKDPGKRRELLAEFESRYSGTANAGRTVGLTKDAMDVKDVRGNTAREMDFGRSADATRDEILAGHRVPGIIAGVTRDVQNRATAEAAEYVFSKWTIAPKLALVEEQVNLSFVQPNYGDDVRLKFYSPVPADREQERQDQDLLARHHSITYNELRELHGYESVPWGDKPIDQFGPFGGEAPPVGGQGQTLAVMSPAIETLGFNQRNRRAISRLHQEQQAKFARAYRKVFTGLFTDLKGEFLNRFDAGKQSVQTWRARYDQVGGFDWVDEVLSPKRLSQIMQQRSKPYTMRGLILGGNFDGDLVSPPGRSKWGADAKALVKYAAEYGDAYWNGVADTTHKQMTGLLGKMIEERATWDEIRAAVAEAFDAMATGRAANIATTETTKLMGAGAQAFREEFELLRKQWVASFVNTRDTHAEADGQVVENRAYFEVGRDRMLYPGGGTEAEENCNCNCAAVAVPK